MSWDTHDRRRTPSRQKTAGRGFSCKFIRNNKFPGVGHLWTIKTLYREDRLG